VGQRILGRSEKNLSRDRIGESPLSNALTDALLAASGAEVALLNTGGLREAIPAGDISYATFFTVLPFNNRAVVIDQLEAPRLIRLLEKSIRTCGDYGALLAGGIRVEFERHCPAPLPGAAAGVDEKAQLTRVVFTSTGEVLLDHAQGIAPSPERRIRTATLDFLTAGGSAYSDFVGTEISHDLGIFREVLVDQFLKNPPVFSGGVDGRWKNIGSH
jgi:5'-nucleotidase